MRHSIQSLSSDEADLLAMLSKETIQFPQGVPAFEEVKEFSIVAKEEDLPFLWLQAIEVPHLAFLMIDPFIVLPDYQPDVLEEDVTILGIQSPEDALILSIVNMKQVQTQGATINLVGPILINWKKRIGKQVIIRNHMDYSVKHLIDVN